jgi:transposase
MGAKISKLQEALTGHFEDQHGFSGQMMLERIDELTTRSTS